MLKLYNGKAYDFDKEPSDTIQNAYDAKVEFDKGYMLTFKVIVDDKGLHKKIREEMIVVCKGGYKNKENAFRIKERLEFGTYVEFKCPHIFYDLDHKRTKVPSGLFTANDILSFIEQNTEDISDFKFKHDYIYGDAKLEFGNYKELRDKKDGEKVEPKVEYYNTLELMNKVFNEYDCEFMFDFWTINVYNKLGEDKESLIYEYKNIEDWEGIHSMEGKATRVFAQSDFERTTTYKTKYPNQKLYIHFAYGNDNKGKDFTNTNYQSRTYIGYYVDTKYQNSPNAKDYKWVNMKIPKKTKKKPAFKGDRKVKGITTFMVGTDYRDGIPIKLDKKTFYLHTAFANYLDGKDININDGTGAKYVGFMIDDKKDNTRVKEWFTFNHLTEKGGLLINDRRTLKEKVHLETTVDSPLVNDYAQIYHDTYINNDARTVDELWQNVLDLFDEGWDKPRRTIKCKVKLTNNDRHRLTTLGDYLYYGDNDPCDIYDTVILRYITHNVDERIKCIGFEYDPINENLEMLKFGSKEKNDTISSSVTSGVKANIEQKQTEFDRRWKEINDYYDEELRKGREEFNHIWLSEKIDFINGFNEYGEYVEDIQAELDRIDAERQQRAEELNKRLAENDKLLKTTKESLIANTNQAINVATEELNRIDKEIVTINNNVVDLNKTKADIKEVYTKKDVDFKVDELNNSITSEVTKTVYSKVNSSINSQEYINKLKGANGKTPYFHTAWANKLEETTQEWTSKEYGLDNTNEFVFGPDITEFVDKCGLNRKYKIEFDLKSKDISKRNIINVYPHNGNGSKYQGFAGSYTVTTSYQHCIIDNITFYLEKTNPKPNTCITAYGNYNTGNVPVMKNVKITAKEDIIDFSTTDSSRDYIGTYTDYVKADSTDYKKYSWSKIKGEKGEFEGEIGGRNLLKNSDDLNNCFYKFDGGNHKVLDSEITEFGIKGKRIYSEAGNQTDGTKEIMLLDSENLIDNKTYTFSMYVKNNRDVPMRFNIKSIECDFIELKPNETKRLVVTGKKIEDTYANGKFRVFFNANTRDYYIDCTVSRPQLEEGDVATSWSKNPNDFIDELGLAREEFKSFKEETEKHFLQTVSLDKYNQFNQLYQKEQSELKQTVNEINSKITKTQGDLKQYSNLSQKVNSMSSTVAQIEPLKLSHAKLEQKVNGIKSSVTEIGKNTTKVSTLTQKVDNLTSTVSSLSNGLDSKIGSIIDQKKSTIVLGIGNITDLQKNLDSLQSSITVNEKSITAKADKIDLEGKVSFSDLNYENKGRDSYTFIDGGRIITDTITSLQIQAEAIMSSHLYVSKAMITKLNTENLLAKEILADNIFAKYIETFDISANRIKTGVISAENGVSRINLNDGTFNFYNGSLTIDETYKDPKTGIDRARLHTQSTFRVSYAGNAVVELNSGGIYLFHEEDSNNPRSKLRINRYGLLDITAKNGNTLNVQAVEIGNAGDGFMMNVYGSLHVHGNIQADKSIKYGESISKDSY